MKIAIDGTAASGKGTLSDNLSKELKLPCLDTGLLYRKLAFMYIKSLKLIICSEEPFFSIRFSL